MEAILANEDVCNDDGGLCAKQEVESASSKVPTAVKLTYGMGSFADNILGNIVLRLALPIYNIALGVDPALIGLALFIPRVWDAVSDPLIGYVSDNTRSRFGRRRPYIFLGAILAGIFLALMWMPPASLPKTGLFVYFLIFQLLFYTAFTIFGVPFHALGLELTTDYDGRTNVQAFKSLFVAISSILAMPWIYRLCFYKGFGDNEVEGARVVGLIYGALVIIFGIMPAIFCRENLKVQSQSKISIFNAIKYTCSNKEFLCLACIVLSIAIGVFTVIPIMNYINIYYVAGGDKALGAQYASYYGMTSGIVSLLTIPVITWLSAKFGKRRTIFIGISMVMISFSLSWLLFNPNYPYLQLIVAMLFAPGINVVWILLGSICADVCDVDELRTGLRREAMYTSVYGWFFKLGIAAILMISGLIVKLSGFNAEISVQAVETITKLRLMYALIPPAFLLVGMYFTWKFPLTKERVQEIQKELAIIRKQRSGQEME